MKTTSRAQPLSWSHFLVGMKRICHSESSYRLQRNVPGAQVQMSRETQEGRKGNTALPADAGLGAVLRQSSLGSRKPLRETLQLQMRCFALLSEAGASSHSRSLESCTYVSSTCACEGDHGHLPLVLSPSRGLQSPKVLLRW